MAILFLLVVFLMGVLSWLILTYNKLVSLRNRLVNAFAQIDVQLKRRHDLIPNLVETAKGYLAHERGTLENVIAARNLAQTARQAAAKNPADPQAVAALAQAEGALSTTVGRLFALVESYPTLKANENMMQLSEELTSTENKVAFARQGFNDAVMDLNIAVQSFPALLFSRPLGFTSAAMLQPIESESERKAPVVKF